MDQDLSGRRFSEPMKRAIQRLLEGETYRAAAQAEGVDYRNLATNAATVEGLKARHLQAVTQRWREQGKDVPPHLIHKFEHSP